ncbi:hypothetical protein F5887DRAFT_857281, partial [Amanita rubescens]
DLGQGYTLLRACDSVARAVSTQDAQAILNLWDKEKWPNRDGWANHKTVIRWARLRLPNGQKVCSAWGEGRSLRRKRKRTTIVRFILNDKIEFGECRYFFRLKFDKVIHTIVVLSKFSHPDVQLLQESNHTVYSCHYQGDSALVACNISCIKMLVAMVPYFKVVPET